MSFMGIEHWTIAICDDDEIFLSRLEKQIRAELQQLNVVGEIVSYTDSEKLLETKLHQTEIFFLDIDMPEVTGMELAAKLEEQNPQAIFTGGTFGSVAKLEKTEGEESAIYYIRCKRATDCASGKGNRLYRESGSLPTISCNEF